jgi:hypothetical protein
MLKFVTAILSILKSSERISVPLLSPPPPPLATWTISDSGEVIALNIPLNIFAIDQSFYTLAIDACLTSQLGLVPGSVVSQDWRYSSVGTTLVFFDVILPPSDQTSTSSEIIYNSFAKIRNFFTHCNEDYVCCPAVPNSPLLTCFKNQGLPVTNIYYNNQCA